MAALATLGLGTAGAQTDAGVTTPGVTDDSVKIGGIATLTSPFGFSQPNVDVGFEARIARANEQGIHGRTIDFIGMKDDKISAQTSAQLARELVQQDEVFLLAPVVSPVFGAGDFLQQEGVPYLGWGVTAAFCNNDFGFGFDGCLFPLDPATTPVSALQGGLAADLLRQEGESPKGKTVAVQTEDIPAGELSKDVVGKSYEAAGLEVVYSESSVPVVPGFDWSPFVQAIMTSADGQPPDVVNVGMTVPNAVGLIGALNNAGYEGIMLSPVTYDNSVIEDPTANQSAQGSYVFTNYAAPQQKTTATKQLLRDVKKFDPEVPVDYQVVVGYWIADALVQMLETAGTDLTRESFFDAANEITIGEKGGYGPHTYPDAHEVGGQCGSLLLIKGEKFVPKVKFKCYGTTGNG